MSQYNKQRHAAAILIHQIGSGIDALDDLPRNIALENKEEMGRQAIKYMEFWSRLIDIELAKNELCSTHN